MPFPSTCITNDRNLKLITATRVGVSENETWHGNTSQQVKVFFMAVLSSPKLPQVFLYNSIEM